MALREACFTLVVAIQPPAEYAVTDDQGEVPGRKMTFELLEGSDHVLARSEAGGRWVGLEGPEIEVGKIKPLIVGGVVAAADEQDRPARRCLAQGGEEQA